MNIDSGIQLKELRVDGGASMNDFLMQFQADLLGVPVDRPEIVETTAAGSAFLAGLATGVWNSPSQLEQVRRTDKRFEPGMEESQRGHLYDGWKRAVARVRSQQGDIRNA
jgi:glycerol kinase